MKSDCGGRILARQYDNKIAACIDFCNSAGSRNGLNRPFGYPDEKCLRLRRNASCHGGRKAGVYRHAAFEFPRADAASLFVKNVRILTDNEPDRIRRSVASGTVRIRNGYKEGAAVTGDVFNDCGKYPDYVSVRSSG